MKKWIENLLNLQAQDMRIRNLEIKYKTIPGERAKLIAEFEAVKKALAEAKADLQKTEQALKNQEAAAAAAVETMKKLQIQSASVKKNADYQAMLAEIEKCRVKISDIESAQIELLDQIEEKKKLLRTAEKNYNSTGRAVQAEVRELDQLKADIIAEAKEKAALVKHLESKVEMNVLEVYKRLRASGKGEPLSAIRPGGMCSNCNLKLTPQTLNLAAKGNMALCDNCSHMVYDPDAGEEY